MLEPHSLDLPLKTQAQLLGVSRSSLYYRPLPPSPEEVRIKHRIDEIYTRWPFYGSRRITVVLNQEEIAVSRPTVQRYMPSLLLDPTPVKRLWNIRFTPICCVT